VIGEEVERRFGAFLRERVNPGAEERDRDARPLPTEIFLEAARIGLWGLASPVSLGGGGLDAPGWAAVLEEIAFHCVDLPFSVLLCATPRIAAALAATGRDDLIRRYALPMIRGERIAALALHEEGAEPLALGTVARETADGWTITGEKSLVTGGMLADPFLVMARDVASDDVLGFLVEPSDPGVTRTAVRTLGARSCGFARLSLDDVRVGHDRVACSADGLGWVNAFFAQRRWEEAAMLVGAMRASFEACVRGLRARSRGGRPLLDQPNVQEQLGRMVSGIASSRALVHEVMGGLARGEDLAALSTVAKHHASERAMELGLSVVRVQGAAGYVSEHPFERYLRDALAMICAAGHQDSLLREMGEQAVAALDRSDRFPNAR
jgi:alkylation response protein AidB-like acyl-CoA dehydrogenase